MKAVTMSLRLQRRVHVLEIACLCLTLFLPHATAHASQLSGWVYLDRNNDGQIAFSDQALPDFVLSGVEIKLFQIVNSQEVQLATDLTDDEGRYYFGGLSAGTYTLRQIQPVQYVDGLDTLGALRNLVGPTLPGGSSAGTMSNNAFAQIVLPTANVAGEMYNFGELGLMPGYVSKRFLLASAPPLPTSDGDMIPEPASLALLASGIGWVALRRRLCSSS
jgi:hypothetical protein